MIPDNKFKSKFEISYNSSVNKQKITRFIHVSDIHLGSHQYSNEYRSDDFIRAFQEILELAIKHHVDFVLLGGDVFTSLEILPGKLMKIVNILKEFKISTNGSILIIAIEGNHDIRKFSRGFRFERRGQSWLKLLNSLGLIILLDADFDVNPEEMFQYYNYETNKGGKIKIKDVMIYGTHYLGEKPISCLSKIRKGIKNDNGLFNILIQHFGIEGQMENIPGIKLNDIQHLRHRVNYLALGHFHKQYILQDWIYNPGSSEAVCSVDFSYKRGIFLVEVMKKCEKFTKVVKILQLINRRYIWETIKVDFEIRDKKDLERFLINKLHSHLKYLNQDIDPSNPHMPILYLILKGNEPSKSCKVNEKDLRKKICHIFPVVDVKIYKKYKIPVKTLDNFILA